MRQLFQNRAKWQTKKKHKHVFRYYDYEFDKRRSMMNNLFFSDFFLKKSTELGGNGNSSRPLIKNIAGA